MHIATWDVGDLDSQSTHGRRTGLIAHEFSKYNLDIIAISATQNVERDYPIEQVGGYTFFWNGRGGERRHIVGFALKDAIACRLTENPVPISEDILSMRVPLKKQRFAVFVSVCGPAPDDGYRAKVEFYNILDRFLSAVPGQDRLFLMGNFNATVGKCGPQWEGVIGNHGHGIANSTGYSLLQLCVQHNLIITNTVHEQKEQNKTTWLHPYALEWLLVDYVIVRRKDHYDVMHSRAIAGMVWSYHRLVRSKISLAINMNIGNPPFVRRKNVKKQKSHSTPNPTEKVTQEKVQELKKTTHPSKNPKKQLSKTDTLEQVAHDESERGQETKRPTKSPQNDNDCKSLPSQDTSCKTKKKNQKQETDVVAKLAEAFERAL